MADKPWIRKIALPLASSDKIEATGRYEFGWFGHVDFDAATQSRCGCGGCRVAERPRQGNDFATAGLAWLTAIREGSGEPEVLHVVELGCPCCQRLSDLCSCDIRRAKRSNSSIVAPWTDVCLVHHVEVKEKESQ